MLFSKKIFFIFIFFSLCFKTIANDKINFVDIDYLFENSNLGKSISLNLKKIHSKNINNLKLQEKVLIEEENKIKKQKKLISSEEFNINVSSLKKKINKFNTDKDALALDFNKKKI